MRHRLPDHRQRGAGQDVAAARSPVAEDAVVQQRIGVTVVQAEEGRRAVAAPRAAGLAEIDVGGQHGKGDVGANLPRLVEHRRAEAVEAKPAATLPADAFGNAALFAVDDLVQARNAMADGVRAHFDADVAAAHLVCYRRGGAGAEEGIEDEVAGVGGDVEDALQEAFGLGGIECVRCAEENVYLLLCLCDCGPPLYWSTNSTI